MLATYPRAAAMLSNVLSSISMLAGLSVCLFSCMCAYVPANVLSSISLFARFCRPTPSGTKFQCELRVCLRNVYKLFAGFSSHYISPWMFAVTKPA